MVVAASLAPASGVPGFSNKHIQLAVGNRGASAVSIVFTFRVHRGQASTRVRIVSHTAAAINQQCVKRCCLQLGLPEYGRDFSKPRPTRSAGILATRDYVVSAVSNLGS